MIEINTIIEISLVMHNHIMPMNYQTYICVFVNNPSYHNTQICIYVLWQLNLLLGKSHFSCLV